MQEYSLREVIDAKLMSRSDLADQLGVTHGAITQMLASDRDIRVVVGDTGRVTAYEKKQIPAYKRASA